jgi:hypothetical protein
MFRTLSGPMKLRLGDRQPELNVGVTTKRTSSVLDRNEPKRRVLCQVGGWPHEKEAVKGMDDRKNDRVDTNEQQDQEKHYVRAISYRTSTRRTARTRPGNRLRKSEMKLDGIPESKNSWDNSL